MQIFLAICFYFFIIFCLFEAKTSNVAAKRMLLEQP